MRGLFLLISVLVSTALVSCDQTVLQPDDTVGKVTVWPEVLQHEPINYMQKDANHGDDYAVLNDGTWWVLLSNSTDVVRAQIPLNYDLSNGLVIENIPVANYEVILTNYAVETGDHDENLFDGIMVDQPAVVDMQYHGSRELVRDGLNADVVLNLEARPQLAQLKIEYDTIFSDVEIYAKNDTSLMLNDTDVYFLRPTETVEIEFTGSYNGKRLTFMGRVGVPTAGSYSIDFDYQDGDLGEANIVVDVNDNLEDGGEIEINPGGIR